MKQAQIVGNKDMPLIEANNIDHVAPDRDEKVGFHLHVFKRSWYILPFGNVSQLSIVSKISQQALQVLQY